MTNTRRFLLCVVGLVAMPALALADEVVVVVAANSPVNDVSSSTLRRAFLGEPTDVSGVRLVPLNQALNAAPRVVFDRVVLKLEPDAVSKFWIDQRIRGRGAAPRAVPQAAMIGRLVPQLPGAVAYLAKSEVGPGLKVLTVDGKKPGEAGYPLK